MALVSMAACVPVSARPQGAHVAHDSPVLINAAASVRAHVAPQTAAELTRLRIRVGRDFSVFPGSLTVWIYGSHAAFSQALWRVRHQRPQTVQDNTSSVFHGTLLLGPVRSGYLHHNLAHVYTEWVMDRLTGNTSDQLPDGTWLYDGLAEYEAYRYAPGALRCGGSGQAGMDVTAIRTARDWMKLRPGPMGSLEYCLAYLEVRRLVAARGWEAIVQVLRSHQSWAHMAAHLERATRDRSTRPPAL